MTPPERANYLIKELGFQKANDHINWVLKGCDKELTREYWREVKREVEKMKLYLQK
jgi:hypothetical protein